jgi:hypothetical protein
MKNLNHFLFLNRSPSSFFLKKKKQAATFTPFLALAKQTRETTQIHKSQRNSPHFNKSFYPSIFPTAAGGHNTHFPALTLPAKRSRSPSPDFSLSQLPLPTDNRLIFLLPTFPTHSPVSCPHQNLPFSAKTFPLHTSFTSPFARPHSPSL